MKILAVMEDYIKNLKKESIDKGLFYLLGVLFFLVLGPLVTMKSGFVVGDYTSQMYPWSKVYSEALGQGYLPLWTKLLQCGFPMFAEGQTGMLYILNIFLFGLLPFREAYNWMFLSHFLMGIIFSYLLARKQGLSRQASTLSAACFSFGSAYAGGFYTIVAMRAAVWAPLCLYSVDDFLEKKKLRSLLLLSFAVSQSWLGGFPQLAVYVSAFTVLYALLKGHQEKSIRVWAALAASFLLAGIIALPQIWATLELGNHSTRTLQEKSFIFWGSLPPWSAISLFFTSWGKFLKCGLYIGIMPFLLVLTMPKKRKIMLWWLLAGASFLLAMGRFNPLYWLLTELPGASLLRNPSKFIYFTNLFLSVIAGFAFDAWKKSSPEALGKFLRKTKKWLLIFAGIQIAGYVLVKACSTYILKLGQWYVQHFVLQKSYHNKSPEEYFAGVETYLKSIQANLSFSNPLIWLPFVLGVLFLLFQHLLMRRPLYSKISGPFIMFFLLFDLWIYAFSGYGTAPGNIGPFPNFSSRQAYPKDARWISMETSGEKLFWPNMNLLTGHSLVGAYSPLLDRDYFLLTKDLAVSDDSFGFPKANIEALRSKRDLIDFIGVGYITVDKDTVLDGYERLSFDGKRTIYKNNKAFPEYTLNGFPSPLIKTIKSSDLVDQLEINTNDRALLVRNQLYDKGWHAVVNGQERRVQRHVGVFQAVLIEQGKSEVKFYYCPDYIKIGLVFYVLGLVIVGLGFAVPAVRNFKI